MDYNDTPIETVHAYSAETKSSLIDELLRTKHSIVGINDNGNGTFTIFYRDTEK